MHTTQLGEFTFTHNGDALSGAVTISSHGTLLGTLPMIAALAAAVAVLLWWFAIRAWRKDVLRGRDLERVCRVIAGVTRRRARLFGMPMPWRESDAALRKRACEVFSRPPCRPDPWWDGL